MKASEDSEVNNATGNLKPEPVEVNNLPVKLNELEVPLAVQ